MKIKRWNVIGCSREAVQNLIAHGFTPLLAGVLCSRGLCEPEAAEAFLRSGAESLLDPFLLKDMDKAAERLRLAIEKKERVAIYGDYDVDGITATCMLYEYLSEKGVPCIAHIPDRLDDGYGVNENAIRTLAEKGVKLIVTVDCGITAVKEVELARELGMDVVITDHHECAGEIPKAAAVVDPKRPDCDYPFPQLAGVGVAFKLLSALEGRENDEKLINTYGDLVAVGTLADVMPVMEENRVLIRRGMEVLHSGKRAGLASLVEAAGGEIHKLAADKIGYMIAPRLNAAGRMGKAGLALRLLCEKSRPRADMLAKELCDLNRDRQQLEAGILSEALSMLAEYPPGLPIILGSDTWHQGVAGIVASRLSERYLVPTVIVCFDGNVGRGSCRSFGGFDLFAALEASKEHLEGFGGHTLAAGLTIRREKFEAFRKRFWQYYLENTDVGVVPTIDINFEIEDPKVLSIRNVEDLAVLEPWGNGNPQPLFCVRDSIVEQITPISGGRHLKLRLSKNGCVLDCVFFAKTLFDLALKQGDCVDVAFFPQVNEFRGARSVQLLLREAKPSEKLIAQRDREMEFVHSFDTQLSREEKRHFLPDRRNFADVWNTIEGLSDELACFGGDLRSILYGLGALLPSMPVLKIYACLRIFAELGLISLIENGPAVKIAVHSGKRRTDLNSSKLLRRLRA